jgi:competence protein ComEC
VTGGILLDRRLGVPLLGALLVGITALVCWATARRNAHSLLPLAYLAITGAAIGAAYHHWYRNVYPGSDLGNFVTPLARPIHLRGWVEEQPASALRQRSNSPKVEIASSHEHDSLRSFDSPERGEAVVQVAEVEENGTWLKAAGRVQLSVSEPLPVSHVGHYVDVVGGLVAPEEPANPGETDHASRLLDQGIRARVLVKSRMAVTRLDGRWPRDINGWLAVLRGWGIEVLANTLPPEQTGVAAALLLGEYSAMPSDEWDKYIRTGVIHVLVISGLHLAILAAALWSILRIFGIRRRQGALIVALVVLTYAFLTGVRPPTMRAAVMVCACCGAILLRRTPLPANLLAFCWLAVLALNPTNVANAGCQLSFLSVAVLYWGVGRLSERKLDPLERLIEASRPRGQGVLRSVRHRVFLTYASTFLVWLALVPMVLSHYHLISFAGLLIAPPAVFLGWVALLAGALTLVAGAVSELLAHGFGWLLHISLLGCEKLVGFAGGLPASHVYWCSFPSWWVWIFYAGLLIVLTARSLQPYWRWAVIAGLAWICLGLLTSIVRLPSGELHSTFLAVGHGGCAVFETSDGRVLLYDAGSLNGPEVTARRIAPFLWHRGIRRIDEVILSHADLDHFNGLPDLLERFAIGQVTCTPTFAEKDTPGVPFTIKALRKHKVPRRIAQAGDILTLSDMQIDVLHPPPTGPEGNENARSMVLLVRHAGHSILLTGDLEGHGLTSLLSNTPLPVDILMAPHHGSATSNNSQLAAWAQPQIVVSCEGLPRGQIRGPEPYTRTGAAFLGTWPHGAVTIHSRAGSMVVETFQSRQRFVVRRD